MSRRKLRQSDGPVGEDRPPRSNWCNIGFEKFNEECESWDAYIGRLENYFAMLGIDEEDDIKRTQVLIHTMGVATYQKLCDQLSPEKPAEKSYDLLVSTMDLVLSPKSSVIAAEHNFTSRKQHEGEIVGGYPSRTSDLLLPVGNLTVPVGREATLECIVRRTNTKNIKVAWVRAEDGTVLSLDRRVVTHNSRISVSHEPDRGTWRLHIRQLREADRGCYMCQINTTNMKKQIGCIDVQVPPDILYNETSPDLSLTEGENATLECRATGHPPPRITWRREDGDLITIRQTKGDIIPLNTYNGSLLELYRTDRTQMGAYLCIASNEVPPAVSKRIILNVNFAPVITAPNQLFGSPLGADLQLQCFVEAFPISINYWLKNSGEMLLHGSKYSIMENRSKYKVMMWLVIKALSDQDIGTYTCVATNSLGKAEQTLRVYEIKLQNSPPEEEDKQAAYLGELSGQRGRGNRGSGLGGRLLPQHFLYISWWLFYFR